MEIRITQSEYESLCKFVYNLLKDYKNEDGDSIYIDDLVDDILNELGIEKIKS